MSCPEVDSEVESICENMGGVLFCVNINRTLVLFIVPVCCQWIVAAGRQGVMIAIE